MPHNTHLISCSYASSCLAWLRARCLLELQILLTSCSGRLVLGRRNDQVEDDAAWDGMEEDLAAFDPPQNHASVGKNPGSDASDDGEKMKRPRVNRNDEQPCQTKPRLFNMLSYQQIHCIIASTACGMSCQTRPSENRATVRYDIRKEYEIPSCKHRGRVRWTRLRKSLSMENLRAGAGCPMSQLKAVKFVLSRETPATETTNQSRAIQEERV